MTQIASNSFVAVSIDYVRQVVRVTRSSERGTIGQVTQAFASASAALDRIERNRFRLLLDFRAAPGRNDPEFESAMARHRKELLRDFGAVAVLVQTAAGQLQVSRIGRQDGEVLAIFTEEDEALTWLEGPHSSR